MYTTFVDQIGISKRKAQRKNNIISVEKRKEELKRV